MRVKLIKDEIYPNFTITDIEFKHIGVTVDISDDIIEAYHKATAEYFKIQDLLETFYYYE